MSTFYLMAGKEKLTSSADWYVEFSIRVIASLPEDDRRDIAKCYSNYDALSWWKCIPPHYQNRTAIRSLDRIEKAFDQ
ncbi:hypothetical protein Tco_0365467 [Tanacetum coccineum]